MHLCASRCRDYLSISGRVCGCPEDQTKAVRCTWKAFMCLHTWLYISCHPWRRVSHESMRSSWWKWCKVWRHRHPLPLMAHNSWVFDWVLKDFLVWGLDCDACSTPCCYQVWSEGLQCPTWTQNWLFGLSRYRCRALVDAGCVRGLL